MPDSLPPGAEGILQWADIQFGLLQLKQASDHFAQALTQNHQAKCVLIMSSTACNCVAVDVSTGRDPCPDPAKRLSKARRA
eukprot:1157770-Pelagomonas_calceolata.AAC.14